jgi:hypothetical protein
MKNNILNSPSPIDEQGCRPGVKRWARRTAFGVLVAGLVGLFALPAKAAVPYVSGTYVTPARQGTIQFTPLRRVVQFGYEGRFVIDGKTYPGSLYYPRTGGVGLVWYFGTTGIMSGNTLVSLQADGSFAGPVWFFDRRGNTTAEGTTTLNIR